MKIILMTQLILFLVASDVAMGFPVGIRGEKQSPPQYPVNITAPMKTVTNSGGGNIKVETGNRNLLENPSFSHSTVATGWTSTNVTTAVNATVPDGRGVQVTATASNGTFCQTYTPGGSEDIEDLAIKSGMWVKTSSSSVQVCDQVNGAENLCVNVSATPDNIVEHKVIGIAGATSMGVCLKIGTSGHAAIIDDAYIKIESVSEVIGDTCDNPIDCEYVFTAIIGADGTVSAENLDWINGNAVISDTNYYTTTFNSGIFTVAPNCICNNSVNTNDIADCHASNQTASSVATRTVRHNGSTTSQTPNSHRIICIKQGADYDNAKVRSIIGNFDASAVRGGVNYGTTRKMVAGSAIVAGASVSTSCTTSPCTIYNATGHLTGNITATRSGTGDYRVTIEGYKPNTVVVCTAENSASDSIVNGFGAESAITNGSGELSTIVFASRSIVDGAFGDNRFFVSCIGEQP